MDRLIQDIRYGARGLMRSPGFTIVAVLTLALGIGATTSVFSIADAVLLRPLPFESPEQLVAVFSTSPSRGEFNRVTSAADFLDWRERSTSFQVIAGHRSMNFSVLGGEFPERIRGLSVTSDFFDVFGVQARLGRTLSPEIDVPGGDRVVVLSHSLWQTHFGGDPEVVGRGVVMSDEPYTIVGVMPAEFRFSSRAQAWVASRFQVPEMPMDNATDPSENRGGQYMQIVARLRPGVTIETADADIAAIAEQLVAEYPDANEGKGAQVVSLHESLVGDSRPALYVLLGAVAFVLLIACANVANLLLVRASRRERELAIRRALGAGRARVLRQLLTESVLLALVGGLAGVLIALWATDALLALAPDGTPRVAEVVVDLRILGFALLVATGTGLLFGLAPISQVLGQNPRTVMAGGQSGTDRAASHRTRRAIIVGEVAISLLLLIGAGLMLQTFRAVTAVNPGFDVRDTVVAHVSLPDTTYSEDIEIGGFFDRVLTDLRAAPGVESASAVLTLPMKWAIRGTLGFDIDGRDTEDDADAPIAGYQVVTPDYFATLRIPLRDGRMLTDADDAEAPAVALINEALARRYWPGENPLGQRISWGDNDDDDENDWVTIVGIVGDTVLEGLDRDPEPSTFLPLKQVPVPFMTLVVRSPRPEGEITELIRGVVLEADPGLPIAGVTTFEQVLADSVGDRRFNLVLLAIFALTALALAAIGLYGVLSFVVAQRAREIGIRRAMGAATGDVLRDVIRGGLGPVALGLGIGAVAGLVLSTQIASQVYGVSVTDPLVYLAAVSVLGIVAFVASVLPALRAARVDPMVALRRD